MEETGRHKSKLSDGENSFQSEWLYGWETIHN